MKSSFSPQRAIATLLIAAFAASPLLASYSVSTPYKFYDPLIQTTEPPNPQPQSPAGYYYNFQNPSGGDVGSEPLITCQASARGLAQCVLELCAYELNYNGASSLSATDYAMLMNAATQLQTQQDTSSNPLGDTHGYLLGMFKNAVADPEITYALDGNQTEFVVQSLTAALLQFGTQLNAAANNPSVAGGLGNIVTLIDTMLENAYPGIQTHKAGVSNDDVTLPSLLVSYTNPWLMVCWNETALGQIFANPTWLQQGQTDLDLWTMWTEGHGISEYLSGTYYGTDFDSLGLLYNYGTSGRTLAQAQSALNLFWTDLTANFFPSNERLGGTQSRNYDFARNLGDIYNYLYVASDNSTTGGFYGGETVPSLYDVSNSPTFWVGLDGTIGAVNASNNPMAQGCTAYLPPSSVLNAFSGATSLTTLRRFNGVPGYGSNSGDNYPYGTDYLVPGTTEAPGFSVGSTSEAYDASTSESLTINLPSTGGPGQSTSSYASLINFNMEGRCDPLNTARGDPYQVIGVPSGVIGSTDCTSTGKATNFNPFVASVQNAGTVLFLASTNGLQLPPNQSQALNTNETTDPLINITSNLTFPNGADVWAYMGSTASPAFQEIMTASTTTAVPVPILLDNGTTQDGVLVQSPTAVLAIYLNNVVTIVRVLLATDPSGANLMNENLSAASGNPTTPNTSTPVYTNALQLYPDGPSYSNYSSDSEGSYRLGITHWTSTETSSTPAPGTWTLPPGGWPTVGFVTETVQAPEGDGSNSTFQSLLAGIESQSIAFEPSYTASTGFAQMAWPSMRVRAYTGISASGSSYGTPLMYATDLSGGSTGQTTALLNVTTNSGSTEFAEAFSPPNLTGANFTGTLPSGSGSTTPSYLTLPAEASDNDQSITDTEAYSYTIVGGGPGIWNEADGGQFATQGVSTGSLPVAGNFSVIARVTALSTNSTSQPNWAQGGVMIRQNATDDASPYASVYVTTGEGIRFSYRTTEGGASTRGGFADYDIDGDEIPINANDAPVWVKITATYTGTNTYTFTGYYSQNGVDWLEIQITGGIGPISMTMNPSTAQAGLVVSSYDTTATAQGAFDSFGVIGR